MAAKKADFRDILRDSFPVPARELLDEQSGPPRKTERRREPVDNRLLITPKPTSKNEVVSEAPSKKEAPSKSEAPSQSEGVECEAGEVCIERNYMRLDMDVFAALASMTGAEAKVYLDLIRRSYGQLSARNICSCTNPLIAESTGVTSPATLAKALDTLERKGFIKRLFIARKAKERSMYRVFLPSELPGAESRTVIRHGNRENG